MHGVRRVSTLAQRTAEPKLAHPLHIRFTTEEEFRTEFAANISNGGIFVSTPDPPELRSSVAVVIELLYIGQTLSLDGEVVHCVPQELSATGASPGVAIHFDDSLLTLREAFAPYLVEPAPAEKKPESPPDPRRARRFPASVPTRIRTSDQAEGESAEGRTRNISRYGALVAPYGEPIAIGESITIRIFHPSTGEELEVDGTVMRHELAESGEVTGMGVEFHLEEAEAEESARFLEDVQTREHSRRLGAITGPIEELGINTLLSMFGTCSPSGTLTVTRDAEEGFIAFQDGQLRAVRVGKVQGLAALARMLVWRRGFFEFEASADESRFEGEPMALDEALFQASQRREARRRERIKLRSGTKLRVDTDAAEEAADELSETDRAILDLAGAGLSVGKIVEVIPEAKRDVASALSNLVKRGLISPA